MARRKKTNEDQPNEDLDNVNESDDNFGLPEIEYKPLNREEKSEETIEVEEEVTVNRTTEYDSGASEERDDHIFNPIEERPSSAPKVIGFIIVVLLLVGAAYYFMVYQPKKKSQAEKARQEELARLNLEKQQAADRLAEQKRQDEQRRADSLANAAPKIGTIETLSGRTGRYYVIVASDIDDDLIMDYAKKLSLRGISSTIIPSHGDVKYFRIGVASGDTYTDAQGTADALKDQYEGGAWVVKY